VMPGDCIVAAEEGIVVVPRADVEAVMARAREMEAAKGRPEELKKRLGKAEAGKIHGHGQGLQKALDEGKATFVHGTWSES
jgi:regulator of RNase E activity RraA